MLGCRAFYLDAVTASGFDFYAGVPDSLLKDYCAYVTDHTPPERNFITANEGSAIALAAGHYLATGRPGVVYLQNSGLGNTVNPLTSLADQACYGIPMLLVIGWRGEPGKKDEPQHVKMGSISREVLDAIGVEWAELPQEPEAAQAAIALAAKRLAERPAPYAFLVRAGTFEKYKLLTKAPAPYAMSREEAIGAILDHMPADALIVATTGMPSRELYEHREQRKQGHERDFLTVGSMGHSSQIALGIALTHREKKVYCLDGDGAVLMHMGGLATIGTSGAKHYKHICLNNGAHDSVGGQPTVAFQVDLPAVAQACGYPAVFRANSRAELDEVFARFDAAEGPAFLEVRVKIGHRDDLGRPKMSPAELKVAYMASIAS
ncbi:MAG: phosphonopyruvate decarboxylase [Myxococcota bacterium]